MGHRRNNTLFLAVTIAGVGFSAIVLSTRKGLRVSRGAAEEVVHPPQLIWDFTRGIGTEVVRWPAETASDLWREDRGAFVTVVIKPDRTAKYFVHSYQVRRAGGQVTSVMLGMPCESAQAAHDRAIALARHWGVLRRMGTPGETDPLRRLEAWYAGYGPGGTGKGVEFCEMVGPRDDSPGCTIAIRACYFEKKPQWYVTLAFGGFPNPPAPAVATQDQP